MTPDAAKLLDHTAELERKLKAEQASRIASEERAAVLYSLVVTAKMNDIDPQAWLADVLARIARHPSHWLDDLLPWNWRPAVTAVSHAA
jgi:hypothetical protein